MMKKLLLSIVLLAMATLLCGAALAEFTVLDHGMYILPSGKGIDVLVVYELQSNNPGAVYQTGTNAHLLLLDSGNRVLASQNVHYDVKPLYIAPGGRAFVSALFRYSDTGLTSASQIADYQLNLTANIEASTKVDPNLTASSVSLKTGRSFFGIAGDPTVTTSAAITNRTGAAVSSFRAVFVFRDRSGHLLYACEESYNQSIPAGGSVTVEGAYIPLTFAGLIHDAGEGVTLEVIPYSISR